MIWLSALKTRKEIFDFRFSINHNYMRRRTPIFRFLRIVWPGLSNENLKNNFPRVYKISNLSRFGTILIYRSPIKKHEPSKAAQSKLKSIFLSTYSHSLSHKIELDVYHCVIGSSDQKNDSGQFCEHPYPNSKCTLTLNPT